MLFESEDDDKWDRSMQPIYIRRNYTEGKTMSNKLNSFMDHVWDGFYTGQVRLSRFPGLIEGKKDTAWDLVYTATPAKKQKFTFTAIQKTAGMTIRIAYPGAESRSITKDGEIVEYNEWDDSINGYGPIKQTKCGENRFIGVKNILEFYITDGCTLQIQPRDAIQTLVRMEWSFDEFYAEGGTTSFIDRLAGSLGIHASTIKVVSVFEGSLVVNYEIAPTKEEPLSLEDLAKKQTEKFAEGKVDLGAPILDVAAGEEKVVSDGVVTAVGFTPVVLVKTATNSNAIMK